VGAHEGVRRQSTTQLLKRDLRPNLLVKITHFQTDPLPNGGA
jgi:hypothetical protein